MRISMVSEHASPLAVLGGADAGGQNVHVAALRRRWRAAGRRSSCTRAATTRSLPEYVELGPGVLVAPRRRGPAGGGAQGRAAAAHASVRRAAARRHGATTSPTSCTPTSGCRVTRRSPGARALRHPARADVPRARARQAPLPGRQGHEPAGAAGDRARARRRRRTTSSRPALTRCSSSCASEPRSARLTVIPCGVDLEPLPPGRAARAHGRPAFARLLSVGRLVERKGIGNAIEALAQRRRTPSSSSSAGLRAPACDRDAEARRLLGIARRAGRRRPRRAARPRVARRPSRPHPLRRRRRRRAVVRAVRDRAAGGDGLRRAGGRRRGRRDDRHGRRRRDRRARRRRATRSASPSCCATVLADAQARRRLGPRRRAPRAAPVRLEPHRRRDPRRLRRPRRERRPRSRRRAARGAPLPPRPVSRASTSRRCATPPGRSSSRPSAWTAGAEELAGRLLDGGRLLACGNGGSAAQAQHLTAELVGRYQSERRPLQRDLPARRHVLADGDRATTTAPTRRSRGRCSRTAARATCSSRSAPRASSPNVLAAVRAARAGGPDDVGAVRRDAVAARRAVRRGHRARRDDQRDRPGAAPGRAAHALLRGGSRGRAARLRRRLAAFTARCTL